MLGFNAYLSVLGNITCLLLGALIAQIARQKNNKKDDDKIRKEILFYLMELRFFISSIDANRYAKILRILLLQRFPVLSNADNAEIERLIAPKLSEVIEPIMGKKYPDIAMGYKSSILKLSSVDPLFAHQLSGREKVIEMMGELRNIMLREADTNESILIVEKLSSELRQKIFIDFPILLEELMIDISRSISRKYLRLVQKEIHNIKNTADEIPDGFEDIFNRIEFNSDMLLD